MKRNNYQITHYKIQEIGTLASDFVGTESNSSYALVGSDDANYFRMTSVNGKYYVLANRFEMVINEDPTLIKRIDIKFKGHINVVNRYSFVDSKIYNNVTEN